MVQGKKATAPHVAKISYNTVKEELSSASVLLDAQIDAGLDADSTLKSLFASTKHRMQGLYDVSRAQCAELTALVTRGPWTGDMKRELAQVLGNVLVADTQASSSAYRRPNQSCVYIENFIPMSTWKLIRSADPRVTNHQRAYSLAQLAASLNLVNPSSPTLFRMVAIIAYGAKNYDMPQSEVFDLMDRIQDQIKMHKTNQALEYIVDFPVSAAQLPTPLFEHAYAAEDEIPVDLNIPELDGSEPPRRNCQNGWNMCQRNIESARCKQFAQKDRG